MGAFEVREVRSRWDPLQLERKSLGSAFVLHFSGREDHPTGRADEVDGTSRSGEGLFSRN